MTERTWAKIINIDCMSKARSNLSLIIAHEVQLDVVRRTDSPQPEEAPSEVSKQAADRLLESEDIRYMKDTNRIAQVSFEKPVESLRGIKRRICAMEGPRTFVSL